MTTGLRERKKLALRERLGDVALELAQERGLAGVRVEDIAERVGVSRRTFSNYFASKEDAIVDRHVGRIAETVDRLRDAPPEQPLWAALTDALVVPFTRWDAATSRQPDEALRALIAVFSDDRLQSALTRRMREARTDLAAAVAERTGTDPRRDLYPNLVARIALETEMQTISFWIQTNPPQPLVVLLADAFRQVSGGLAEPS
ncbi:TetR/AcrR family transcriptional regulator [Kutzneria sp. CA-103260]|uniref:TetR/AcrR family transcriptional regulator n=1 Tax=Kutzneria sp. CA-103260 TaxID=2802641 RepID=UPI001BAE3773|nr:TetR/AcrR family transcriptional regulator [Kutzneria sp. CA-103260]QUQ64442.1 TetR family transcriptional regulator [Kutzneria sp. CA-103260]